MSIQKVYAAAENTAITNPAFKGQSGDPASSFGNIMASSWKAVITLGGLALLLYLAWGGAEWVLSGGDKAKLESAKNKITQGVIGMAILSATVAIAIFFSSVLKIDLLNPTFFGPGE